MSNKEKVDAKIKMTFNVKVDKGDADSIKEDCDIIIASMFNRHYLQELEQEDTLMNTEPSVEIITDTKKSHRPIGWVLALIDDNDEIWYIDERKVAGQFKFTPTLGKAAVISESHACEVLSQLKKRDDSPLLPANLRIFFKADPKKTKDRIKCYKIQIG